MIPRASQDVSAPSFVVGALGASLLIFVFFTYSPDRTMGAQFWLGLLMGCGLLLIVMAVRRARRRFTRT